MKWHWGSMLAGVGIGAAAVTMMKNRNNNNIRKIANDFLKGDTDVK